VPILESVFDAEHLCFPLHVSSLPLTSLALTLTFVFPIEVKSIQSSFVLPPFNSLSSFGSSCRLGFKYRRAGHIDLGVFCFTVSLLTQDSKCYFCKSSSTNCQCSFAALLPARQANRQLLIENDNGTCSLSISIASLASLPSDADLHVSVGSASRPDVTLWRQRLDVSASTSDVSHLLSKSIVKPKARPSDSAIQTLSCSTSSLSSSLVQPINSPDVVDHIPAWVVSQLTHARRISLDHLCSPALLRLSTIWTGSVVFPSGPIVSVSLARTTGQCDKSGQVLALHERLDFQFAAASALSPMVSTSFFMIAFGSNTDCGPDASAQLELFAAAGQLQCSGQVAICQLTDSKSSVVLVPFGDRQLMAYLADPL
jgi:hypothetical protein